LAKSYTEERSGGSEGESRVSWEKRKTCEKTQRIDTGKAGPVGRRRNEIEKHRHREGVALSRKLTNARPQGNPGKKTEYGEAVPVPNMENAQT